MVFPLRIYIWGFWLCEFKNEDKELNTTLFWCIFTKINDSVIGNWNQYECTYARELMNSSPIVLWAKKFHVVINTKQKIVINMKQKIAMSMNKEKKLDIHIHICVNLQIKIMSKQYWHAAFSIYEVLNQTNPTTKRPNTSWCWCTYCINYHTESNESNKSKNLPPHKIHCKKVCKRITAILSNIEEISCTNDKNFLLCQNHAKGKGQFCHHTNNYHNGVGTLYIQCMTDICNDAVMEDACAVYCNH